MAMGTGKARRADVVLPPLKEDRLEVLAEKPLHQRDVFVEKLLLQVDRVGAHQCLAPRSLGMEDGGQQVGEGFTNTGSRLHHEVGTSG